MLSGSSAWICRNACRERMKIRTERIERAVSEARLRQTISDSVVVIDDCLRIDFAATNTFDTEHLMPLIWSQIETLKRSKPKRWNGWWCWRCVSSVRRVTTSNSVCEWNVPKHKHKTNEIFFAFVLFIFVNSVSAGAAQCEKYESIRCIILHISAVGGHGAEARANVIMAVAVDVFVFVRFNFSVFFLRESKTLDAHFVRNGNGLRMGRDHWIAGYCAMKSWKLTNNRTLYDVHENNICLSADGDMMRHTIDGIRAGIRSQCVRTDSRSSVKNGKQVDGIIARCALLYLRWSIRALNGIHMDKWSSANTLCRRKEKCCWRCVRVRLTTRKGVCVRVARKREPNVPDSHFGSSLKIIHRNRQMKLKNSRISWWNFENSINSSCLLHISS